MVTIAGETLSGSAEESQNSSLSTSAARNLATTTKTAPQMQGITSRWLLRLLPWVQVSGGTYRVNRRLTHTVGDGRIDFDIDGGSVAIIPEELRELPTLWEFTDPTVLSELAQRFTQHEYAPGEMIARSGAPHDRVVLIAHGRVDRIGTGKYGDETVLEALAGGDHLGDAPLNSADGQWEFSYRAVTRVTVMALARQDAQEVIGRSPALRDHLAAGPDGAARPANASGESAITLTSGHHGEPALPSTFVDYDRSPREYELSVAQTVLRTHTRVGDLYSDPMNQVEEQLKLTVHALRERQEHEMINNPEFGLLHNADLKQRIPTRSGPPTPDDLDELLATVWKDPGFLLAHPKAIAAIGRECSARGLYPDAVDFMGHSLPSWRGVPIFPCNKIPVTKEGTSSVLLMRTGEDKQGVVGLHRSGIPDEYEPSLSVRFMGIDDKAVVNYLVSAYYSAAILVPDALGVLEDVEIGH
ncbi:family 2B encapsulin nanocompartment shell protein [Streptomyces noursei]|uniref:family 2B encapsulin nanocompartment shell protein n=1 Tax=Streptomyces noursei TaxID=1971 RepID=UPI001672DB9B|nr:family 2B encapsulin nanocompartment shell protein [Streptomyces noursei]MCZ1019349.1 family 2B encapsulin nanocompartment shell protein [Streptomyces noursei]GGX07839.1 Crp/Fnr family transcriptional regulator [Streptomyces noursei]